MSTIAPPSASDQSAETRGLVYGFLGVMIFSLSLSATRLVRQAAGRRDVGFGAGIVARPPVAQRGSSSAFWRLMTINAVLVGNAFTSPLWPGSDDARR